MRNLKEMSQIVFKIAVTIILIIIPLYLILWLWGQQVDLKQTFWNIFKSISPVKKEIIATRDPNKIYQDGKEVGNVTGNVSRTNEYILFEEVCDTGELNIRNPFEYGKYTLKVTHIDEIVGIKMGTHIKKEVKSGMKCMILK